MGRYLLRLTSRSEGQRHLLWLLENDTELAEIVSRARALLDEMITHPLRFMETRHGGHVVVSLLDSTADHRDKHLLPGGKLDTVVPEALLQLGNCVRDAAWLVLPCLNMSTLSAPYCPWDFASITHAMASLLQAPTLRASSSPQVVFPGKVNTKRAPSSNSDPPCTMLAICGAAGNDR